MSEIFNFESPAALIVNIVLILFIIAETYDGFKKGFLESSIRLLGGVAAFIGAYIIKNPVSVFLYTKFPFFKFSGLFKGVSALNILVYEVIAFILVFIILMILIKLIARITGIVERALSVIIFFGIPNKILGAAVGFVKSIIILYFVIFIFKFACNFLGYEMKASLADTIVNAPILKNTFGDSLNSFDEITALAREYDNTKNKEEFNEKAIDILLEYNIITEENLQILIDNGKIIREEDKAENTEVKPSNEEETK